MKFLVIGASGFIGSHVMSYVKSSGYQVLGTQSKSKHPELITFDVLRHQIKDRILRSFLEGDDAVFGVICIEFKPIDCQAIDTELNQRVEVEKTIALVEDLINLRVKPILFSSSYVFDGIDGNYDENSLHSPLSNYGKNKAEIERTLQSKKEVLILRLGKIVGNNPSEAHLFTEWYQWMSENKPITCIQGQIISPTFVGDVAKGIVLSCKHGLSGLYNLANPEFFLREELAKQFASTYGKRALIISKPQEEFNFSDPRPLKSYLNSTKLTRYTGMNYTPMLEVLNHFKNSLNNSR